MPLLEIADIAFRAGEKTILNGFSLAIEASEVHALLGANGTGKSTLACLIMGCGGYRPTAGNIVFDGRLINELDIHERARLGITMAWQEPARFEGISAKDYISFGGRTNDPSTYLEMVGLHPAFYINRMVDKSLSGGERKRIELASVLALKPRLAVLDEPDSGIDMLSMQDIVNVINAFKQNGSSVLLITHRQEIAVIANRASQLCGGKIVWSGNPVKVAEYYRTRKCFVCSGEVCAYV